MNKIRQLYNKLTKKTVIPAAKHEVKYAFTCGGVQYFQFPEFDNIPALRGLKSVVFYEEVKMKCTADFLTLHTEAIDNILSKPNINIFEIKKLNDQLKQRLDLAVDIELLYKIASIVFFDNKENIQDYDFAYNARKVEHWKKYGGGDFFLQQPLQELLPVLKSIGSNLKMYSQVTEKMNNLHLDSLLRNLPEDRRKIFKDKNYFSATVMPRD